MQTLNVYQLPSGISKEWYAFQQYGIGVYQKYVPEFLHASMIPVYKFYVSSTNGDTLANGANGTATKPFNNLTDIFNFLYEHGLYNHAIVIEGDGTYIDLPDTDTETFVVSDFSLVYFYNVKFNVINNYSLMVFNFVDKLIFKTVEFKVVGQIYGTTSDAINNIVTTRFCNVVQLETVTISNNNISNYVESGFSIIGGSKLLLDDDVYTISSNTNYTGSPVNTFIEIIDGCIMFFIGSDAFNIGFMRQYAVHATNSIAPDLSNLVANVGTSVYLID